MNDLPVDGVGPEDDEPELIEAGARVRADARPLDPSRIPVAVLQRRNRRRGVLAGGLAALVIVLGVALVVDRGSSSNQMAKAADSVDAGQVDAFLASLPDKPVDPTQVKLVSDVKSFPGCDALIGNLRAVGAKHVGSRGFGDTGWFQPVGMAVAERGDVAPGPGVADTGSAAVDKGATIGTNVQVSGVDELDYVKAEGSLIYDLDGKGNLRITDAGSLKVLSATDVDAPIAAAKGKGQISDVSTNTSKLLVSGGKVAVFGSEVDTFKPVPDDPSATQASTNYLTVVFVDATDPSQPQITDRVKVEGSLVSARMVKGQIRLVTTAHMADIGMVMPTTRTSVPVALERNRRSVATSTAHDWIPEWRRSTGSARPLVPCDRVNVPVTFAGVAMTSMVTFPIGTGRFAPEGTAIVAPATTLYAGLDKVAISSHVWVDPIDRHKLKFTDWQTAIHEFTFPKSGAPDYVGSGVVDGSTIGQFAFGEVGDAIGVVTTKGTPWSQNPKSGVDLTLLTPDGNKGLESSAKVDDLSDGRGAVSAVRYVEGRALVATGARGRDVQVIDLSDPTEPRRAGQVHLMATTEYFHPLPDDKALLIGSRGDEVPGPSGPRIRPWVRAELLDVANADAPKIVATWEVPWSRDEVGADHHAFTYWPQRNLALWGVSGVKPGSTDPNHAVGLDVSKGLDKAAWPVAHKPPVVPPPCPEVRLTGAEAKEMLSRDARVLGCADTTRKVLEWPRYRCSPISALMVVRLAPDRSDKASYFACTPAPEPTVSRVLVVDGEPILMTDQTFETLDPDTFASKRIVYHPTIRSYGMPIGPIVR